MKSNEISMTRRGEHGAALVTVLLMLALLLAMAMGTSLTAISELGVSNTYGTQTVALEAAEAGLNHAASLTMNFTGASFTDLLALRGANQAFPIATATFIEGADMITGNSASSSPHAASTGALPANNMAATEENGHQLRDATGAAVVGASYSVRLLDDEPDGTANPSIPNFSPSAAWIESVAPNASNPNIDKNNRVVIYSTGRYAGATVTLEGWVAFLPYPAFSANGDVEVVGSSDIRGAYGGVHSNKNLSVGNASTIAQSATASGTASITNLSHIGGFAGGNQARLDIPAFVTNSPLASGGAKTSPRLQDFLVRQADRLLIDPSYADGAHENLSNGNLNPGTRRLQQLAERLNVSYSTLATALDTDGGRGNNVQQTTPVAVSVVRDGSGLGTATRIVTLSETGWSHNNSNGWNLASTAASGHTYYVVGTDNYNLASPGLSNPNGGNVKITGNAGSPGSPVQLTILATGSIEISGNPNIVSNLQRLRTPLLPPFVKVDVLMAAVEDIKINGDTDGAQRFSGISYAGEQVYLSGNGTFNGQVIALSNRNVSGSTVNSETNTATGSFELRLDDGNAIGRISLYAWRQIKR